jgi:hypothetical protein
MQELGYRSQGLVSMLHDLGEKGQDLGFKLQDLGYSLQDLVSRLQ